MRDWILFGLTVLGAATGAVGTWFGLVVRAEMAPLRERVIVLETIAHENARRIVEMDGRHTKDLDDLVARMERGLEALGARVDAGLTAVGARIDRALNGRTGT